MPSRAHNGLSSGTPDRKPLYLFAGARIDAGSDHLLLRRDGTAPQRFPVARITRIICNHQASWSGQALSLCLTEGIAITWIDGHGHAIGSAQSNHHPPCNLATLIETYLELQDWPQRFANWLAHQRLDLLLNCARRASTEEHPMEKEVFQELKRQFVYNGTHPLAFEPEGEGFCHALAVDHLNRAQLQATYWGFDASPFELAKHLAALLWAELNLECGTLPASADHRTVVARLFETWAHQREAQLQNHLRDLKCHLAREVDTWQ